MATMESVHRLMRTAVGQGIFPGAVLLVADVDAVLFRRAYGCADLFSGRAMADDTIFDLASLTKPLATTLAVMALVRKGRLDLDAPCTEACPELAGTDKAAVTPRDLLMHRSGLPAWRPYFMRLRCLPADERLAGLRHCLVKEPLVSRPGESSAYSDLGFMLLHWLVEQLAGEPLDAFVQDNIYRPLGIRDLFFNDFRGSAVITQQYAATQLCPWRNRLLIGAVDDDNAWTTGGIAGHAGLFGTAEAVGELLAALLAADRGDVGRGVFDPELVRLFFRADHHERWALGFDTPAEQGSSAGRFFPSDSVGHLGFTGTSFWVHRRRGIVVVLLTNRVHPWRFNPGIKAFRPRLHDAVMKALGIAAELTDF
jgi:CubicO group peptidase (beta-lactamase class C family)